MFGLKRHDAVGLGHVERTQDQALEDAEDDDVGGDAEGEGEDGGEGEAGRPAELADGESQVLEQVVHGRPL